jgi:hypothetical protein
VNSFFIFSQANQVDGKLEKLDSILKLKQKETISLQEELKKLPKSKKNKK